jgi:UDP-glucose 4-epimerase
MLVESMGLANVKLKYTGGERGWPGDVPQVRLDTLRMEKLGWKPKYNSDEAVRIAIKEILGKTN